MIIRAVDNNGDWIFGNSLLDYKEELEAIKQDIVTTIKSWFGDCFFDLEAGVDWSNYLGSFGREQDLKNNIIKVVNDIEEVINVDKYDMYINNERAIIINISINTIYGKINLEENINGI